MTGGIDKIVAQSQLIFGWAVNEDARQIALASAALAGQPVIVEAGVFMGRCTCLLAGARKLMGSGKVHCIDPFDCSGDAFSIPHYEKALLESGQGSLEAAFRSNMQACGVDGLVEVHKGKAVDIARTWSTPVDLLLLDGDQSPQGAREAFEAWVPFLKPGGTIILRNTKDKKHAEGHDGHRRLAVEEMVAPRFEAVRQVGATTFAIKSAVGA